MEMSEVGGGGAAGVGYRYSRGAQILDMISYVFYIPLVEYMYRLICKFFFAKHLFNSWV